MGSDVQTNQAYLDRLQAFLDMQQPASNIENGAGSHTKRKNPSTSSDIDTASSLKDRKHGANSNQHSHIEQREGTHALLWSASWPH
jgi:hypothetical protein